MTVSEIQYRSVLENDTRQSERNITSFIHLFPLLLHSLKFIYYINQNKIYSVAMLGEAFCCCVHWMVHRRRVDCSEMRGLMLFLFYRLSLRRK
jgi:hypothetical protein